MPSSSGPRAPRPHDPDRRPPRRRRIASFRTWASRLLDVALLAGVTWLLARPGSAPRRFLQEVRADREERRALRAAWPALVRGASLGYPGDGGRTVVMFTDYRCPFCRQAQEVVDGVLARDPGARVIVRHLPLRDLHPDAPLLALVSICAEDDPAWPQVHRALPEWPDASGDGPAGGREILAAAGVGDPDEVLRCTASGAARRRLREDAELAERLGLRATPTFVSARTIAAGALSPERLTEMLGAR